MAPDSAPGAAPALAGAHVGWGGSAAAARAPGGVRADRREARRRRLHERRLRRTVARLAGCLYAVPPFWRRVLVLRAGPGRARALSRVAVARRLDVSPRRVRHSERRGLRRLRATNREAGCGRSVQTFGAALLSAPFAVADASLLDALTTSVDEGSEVPEEEGGVLGARTRPRSAPTTLPPQARLGPLGPLEDSEGDGAFPTVVAALLAATLALGVMALRLRRQRYGAPEPPAHRDPRDWEPPPPPWSGS